MRKQGFTIVELLVVVTIIALLLAMVGTYVVKVRKNSQDGVRLNDTLSIGRAIDQYALSHRGIYPGNKNSGATLNRMCSNEIALDLGLFPKNLIPTDPSPSTGRTTGCEDMFNGYTYHTQLGLPSDTSLAKALNAKYVLEVGLEGEKPNDESAFKSQDQVQLTPPLQIDNSRGRYRYLLIGPYCGTSGCS